jgi:hypothetical protein
MAKDFIVCWQNGGLKMCLRDNLENAVIINKFNTDAEQLI